MTQTEALKLALRAMVVNNQAWKHLADSGDAGYWEAEEQEFYQLNEKAITAVKAALEANEFNPDWDTQAVLVEEIQRMAKRIEELEAKDEPVQNQLMALIDENQRLRAELKFNTTPPQRTWVGLTDEDVDLIANKHATLQGAIWAIEAKLKEKNT
jgi:hypothetical protein